MAGQNKIYKQSSEYEILKPEKKDAFIIAVDEWNFIEERVKNCPKKRWFYSAAASSMWSVAATEITSMIIRKNCSQIEILITVFAIILGVFALVFSMSQKNNDDEAKQSAVGFMELVKSLHTPSSQSGNLSASQIGNAEPVSQVDVPTEISQVDGSTT